MKEEFGSYLLDIGAGGPVHDRVEHVLEIFSFLSADDEIVRIFVTDVVNEQTNERQFANLVAFSARYWLEARNFLLVDNADLSPYQNDISYVGLEYEALSFFTPATGASRLAVEVQTGRGANIYNKLTATGSNCDHLITIIKEQFVPNIHTA